MMEDIVRYIEAIMSGLHFPLHLGLAGEIWIHARSVMVPSGTTITQKFGDCCWQKCPQKNTHSFNLKSAKKRSSQIHMTY